MILAERLVVLYLLMLYVTLEQMYGVPVRRAPEALDASDPRASIFLIWDGLRDQGIGGMQATMEDGYSVIICQTENTCLHEVGHVVDGGRSGSPEFRAAVWSLVDSQEFYDQSLEGYKRVAWYAPELDADAHQWGEYYAQLYADWRLGFDLPAQLRPYFVSE